MGLCAKIKKNPHSVSLPVSCYLSLAGLCYNILTDALDSCFLSRLDHTQEIALYSFILLQHLKV